MTTLWYLLTMGYFEFYQGAGVRFFRRSMAEVPVPALGVGVAVKVPRLPEGLAEEEDSGLKVASGVG